ncbi:hypothetical protein AB0875_12600 [Micromonospora gifhornensis]|uniref:hypothetical protein n=1 Tax=Micromonospora gifhornensis TaxID=84594 RepID=UPI003453E45E
MADTTGAERQRRYRAHKQGDHSLCPPGRQDCVTVTSSPSAVTRDTPRGPRLRARGQRMWDQLVGDDDPVEVVALVEEICRTADRLDRLDAIVNGRDRAWLTLEVDDVGEVTVVVDKVLGEARQQQMTFKGLLAELRAIRGASAKSPAGRRAPKEVSGVGGGGITDLTARIARRAQPAG